MKTSLACGTLVLVFGCGTPPSQLKTDEQLHAKAYELAHKFILVDTHIDVPERLLDKWEDISQPAGGNFDYPRARKGGLDAPFMSIYVPSDHEQKHIAKHTADTLIDLVESFVQRWPDKFALAMSPADILRNKAAGKISLPMGMENGAPVEGDLNNLTYFYRRGIRYITLTHAKDNHICDSSYDTTHTWNGLSPFGKLVVAEMNRLGIMIDVSHISDSSFYQVIRLTKAPVIASHSSCRFFTPTFKRNMSDDMIRLLAANGGVIQINFGSDFVNGEYRRKEEERQSAFRNLLKERHLSMDDSLARVCADQYEKDHPIPHADVTDVAANIDHVVKLVGIEYVGIGSDFDGVGDSLPTGLEDVSTYPNLIYELLKMGYSEGDIEKICGKNLLRVWSKVDDVARILQSPS